MTGMADNPSPPHVPGQLEVSDERIAALGSTVAAAGGSWSGEQRRELLAELERYDELRAAQTLEALDRVATAAAADRAAGTALDEAVKTARRFGATWQQIGDAVGITRQSARARWADR
jgi:hypothetical protein